MSRNEVFSFVNLLQTKTPQYADLGDQTKEQVQKQANSQRPLHHISCLRTADKVLLRTYSVSFHDRNNDKPRYTQRAILNSDPGLESSLSLSKLEIPVSKCKSSHSGGGDHSVPSRAVIAVKVA